MDKNTLRMAVSTHWAQVVRPLVAKTYDIYNDEQFIPQELQEPNLPDLLTSDLQSVGVDDFVNDASEYNSESNYLDNLDEWVKENYDFDYLYNMIDQEYLLSGLHDRADELLLERLLDDPTYGQLSDTEYWQSRINTSSLPETLRALHEGLDFWIERYADNWRDQQEDADQGK